MLGFVAGVVFPVRPGRAGQTLPQPAHSGIPNRRFSTRAQLSYQCLAAARHSYQERIANNPLRHIWVSESTQASLEYRANTQLGIVCEQLEVDGIHRPGAATKVPSDLMNYPSCQYDQVHGL